VATQRSFFMTAVVLIAVMVDRRAVTFRTLAVDLFHSAANRSRHENRTKTGKFCDLAA
jgi:hypothetical protein